MCLLLAVTQTARAKAMGLLLFKVDLCALDASSAPLSPVVCYSGHGDRDGLRLACLGSQIAAHRDLTEPKARQSLNALEEKFYRQLSHSRRASARCRAECGREIGQIVVQGIPVRAVECIKVINT